MNRLTLCLSVLSMAALGVADTLPDDYLARMVREHAGDTPIPNPMSSIPAGAEVVGGSVDYADLEGTTVSGYLAKPVEGRPSAAILVIHEWWGLNDNIRAMAERLAGEGYAALAIDLYEGHVAEDRDGALTLARGTQGKEERLLENLRQARAWLAEEVGAEKVGVIGWCFGGGWSLRTALSLGHGIDATVVYYGRVVTDADALAPLSSPVLGIFGAEDRGIPVDGVRQFEQALHELGKEATIHIYEGADHAFANPSGTRYQEEAAVDAWEKTLEFFGEHLR